MQHGRHRFNQGVLTFRMKDGFTTSVGFASCEVDFSRIKALLRRDAAHRAKKATQSRGKSGQIGLPE